MRASSRIIGSKASAISGIVTSGLVLNLDALNTSSYAPPQNRSIRYIRVYANGSTSNPSTHFVEIQALTSSGTNRALNAGANGGVSQYTGGTPEFTVNNTNWQILTDGTTTSDNYIGFASGGAGVQVDLGQIYTDINQIKFWNYYADGRTYYSVTVFISSDGSNWTTIYGPQNTATTAAGISVSNVASSNTWTDLSGNNNNVSLINSPVWNSAGYFSTGATGYFSGPGTSSIPIGNSSYTMQAWVRQVGSWGSGRGIMNIGGYSVINGSNAIRTVNTTPGNFVHYWWSNDLNIANNNASLSVGTWFMVTAQFDGTTRRVWANTTNVGSDTPAGHNVTSTNIEIAKTFSTEYWNGDIGLALIYNRAISESEINQNFNAIRTRYGV